MINTIRDYYQIDENIATSGQPTPQQFSLIADAGYRVIINLAMSCSTNALADEGAIVTDLGMVYVQIPVVWEHPRLEDVRLFFQATESFQDWRIWVHCAKNMRVSCFIYLWQKYVRQLPDAVAIYPMNEIWQPTGVWQELIEQSQSEFVLQ